MQKYITNSSFDNDKDCAVSIDLEYFNDSFS